MTTGPPARSGAIRGASLLMAAIAAIIAVLALICSQHFIPIQNTPHGIALAQGIDFDALFSHIDQRSLEEIHNRVTAEPARLSGSPPQQTLSAWIENELRKLGCEILSQSFEVTIPQTRWSVIEHEDGRPITTVNVVPFWPNLVRTCTTPLGGIVGTIIDGGSGSLSDLDGQAVRDHIVLLKMQPGFDWLNAAKLGAKAILFEPSPDPMAYDDKMLGFPGNLPRFLASGPAHNLVGHRVRIVARVDWQARQVRNVFGILRPPQGHVHREQALTLLTHTDSWSVVPDLAPGYQDACSPTAMLAITRALASQRAGLNRTVIFAALSGYYQMAAGSRRITDALGDRVSAKVGADHADLLRKCQQRRDAAEAAVASLAHDNWHDDDAEAARLPSHTTAARQVRASAINQLLEQALTGAQRHLQRRRRLWETSGQPESGPNFLAYRRAARLVRRITSAMTADPTDQRRFFVDVLDRAKIRMKLGDALERKLELAQWALQHQQDTMRVAELLSPLKENYFLFLYPSAAKGQLGYLAEETVSGQIDRSRDAIVGVWLRWRRQPDIPSHYANYLVNFAKATKGQRSPFALWDRPARRFTNRANLTLRWTRHAVAAFEGAFLPPQYQSPLDRQVDIAALQAQTQLIGALAAQLAASDVALKMPRHGAAYFSDFGGKVLTATTSNALLPKQLVSNSLVVLKSARGGNFHFQKSADGTFRFPAVEANAPDTLLAEAYTIDPRSGQLTGARDLGADGQRFPTRKFKHGKTGIYYEPETRVTVLLARLSPVDLYRTVDAQGHPLTLDLLDARFSTPPAKYSITDFWEQGATVFMEPGTPFYVQLKNVPHPRRKFHGETGRFIKGILHGYDAARSGLRQIEHLNTARGPGYDAAHQQRVVFQEADAAISLVAHNRHLLISQQRSGLADQVTTQLAHRSQVLAQRGLDALHQQHFSEAYRAMNAAMAISARAYPSVKRAVYDAVNGILLYLFLLVPFSYFMERLLFAFSDIRTRLGGMFAIFLLAFGFIRLTHPAYQLISSSMIVLVGFVILILCVLILLFLVGKFSARIRALQRAGGSWTEAASQGLQLGASEAAFGLGISNMRKRKVRTAYTLTTLVLISFCLVCFTTPRSQLRERRIVIGEAAYNGLLLRKKGRIKGDAATTRELFRTDGKVLLRYAKKTEQVVTYIPEQGAARSAKVEGMVYVESEEPRATAIDEAVLAGGRWFGRGVRDVCYLSDTTADELGLDPATVVQNNVHIMLEGRELAVYGVFDSAKVEALRDIDGESFLPVAERAKDDPEQQRKELDRFSANPDRPEAASEYVPAASVVLLPLEADRSGKYASAVVLFYDQPHGKLHELIGLMLDRTDTYLRYALDGLSVLGVRLRSVGIEGYVDVLVPLLVASCIVFNTMLGNVHERRKEISIYSAVGLSPRHVFYLFLAESLVYAVIGVVGGYLLALLLQWINHLTDGSMGLTIDYSSRSAIYVSVTLMAAVIGSSFVPAYQAARAAAPSERVHWVLPTPQAPGQLDFDLPFTYAGPDILAVVVYLTQWYDVHGDDSSGAFAARSSGVEVNWRDSTVGSGPEPVFTVSTSVWPKPFDLGVSQRVAIDIRPSEETTTYTLRIRIQQLTGSDSAWQRTNDRFVRQLRSHLLSWRSRSQNQKQAMFETASKMLV